MSAGAAPTAGVQILGRVGVVAADRSHLDLPSATQRRLLAVLAVHAPRPLRGEWLADVLDLSSGALRTSVSRLRASIGPSVLSSEGAGYALVAPVDADRFTRAVAGAPAQGPDRRRRLEAALALWGGPPLEEFADEEWAEGDAARLTEVHARTVDDCAEALLATGEAADAVARLEAQVADHPYRDRARGLLIRALAASGRQADALRAFQRYRTLLVEELGIEPSTDVVRIERRVATGWDGIDEHRAPPSTGAGRRSSDGGVGRRFATPRPPELPATGTFVGRHDELRQLCDALDRVATGGPRGRRRHR